MIVVNQWPFVVPLKSNCASGAPQCSCSCSPVINESKSNTLMMNERRSNITFFAAAAALATAQLPLAPLVSAILASPKRSKCCSFRDEMCSNFLKRDCATDASASRGIKTKFQALKYERSKMERALFSCLLAIDGL